MKQVAIFYRNRENPHAIQYIENNFYSVLGDYINITNYYLDEMADDEIIIADAYIVCYEEMLRYMVNHVEDFSKVVVITRSIQQKYLESVLKIPPGTTVLVVNDSRESVLQTMYMIYELGIGHIKLIPYEESLAKAGAYDYIDTAIVTYHSEDFVPKHIHNIHNIRNREVSFETFHKLMFILGLETSSVQSNLLHKVKETMNTDANYINSYLSNFLIEQMLTNVVDQSSKAIVLLDNKNIIHYINEKAYNIFKKNNGEVFSCNAVLSAFPSDITTSHTTNSKIITFNDVNYLLEKSDISLLDETLGCCLTFQNETDLREKENSLSLQLKQKGFCAKYTFNDIIHESESMKQCINIAKKASLSDYTILIRGDSGTGKELLAQSIHNYSSRRNYPFVAVNCAAIPENLLESELFGYESGAFTGARKAGKVGLFEQAQHGTIFLDEIGDISPNLQTRLLRALQEKEIMRVGSDKIISIDARVIAATNADLELRIREGRFRNDLFYRLNVIPLNIAPLKKRRDDILPLLKVFLGKKYYDLKPYERNMLLSYCWPGNVRELENVASYYNTMGHLPETLNHSSFCKMDISESSFDDSDILNEVHVQENIYIIRAILKVISQNSNLSTGIGRGSIRCRLQDMNIDIGEGVLKKYLAELKRLGLIESCVGRGGSHITEKGLSTLHSVK